MQYYVYLSIYSGKQVDLDSRRSYIQQSKPWGCFACILPLLQYPTLSSHDHSYTFSPEMIKHIVRKPKGPLYLKTSSKSLS